MLDFFRKYQWYFFLVITIVVIISFSFFGTNNVLNANAWKEQIAFKAIDGEEISRFEVDDMTNFLATDNEDKAVFGVWGANFLNDGVIRKDFLQTGMLQELANFYRDDIQKDLNTKWVKEKKFKPYVHPQGPFISSENAWNYFLPELTSYLQSLKSAENATDPEALNARVRLFLAEKQFPAPMLRQVLTYQERQYNWMSHDPELDHQDLSLFGYHQFEDWFGPRLTRLVTQFIINAAIIAEKKGYQVSKAEALSDLILQTEISFQQNRNSPQLGVATPEEYFNEQLRRLGMDQTRAIKVWRQIMLFRRYFQDVGQSALVDTLTYQQFNDFAKGSVQVDLYHLPASLHLNDYSALQKFEIYLNAVAKRSKVDVLALPTEFFKPKEVSKNYPELVQKRYVLEITQVSKKNLQARIGIKETWNWELDEKNWAQLKKQFPELGSKKDQSREDRLATIDSLDAVTKARLDAYTRSAIVDAHPEWIEKALDEAKPHVKLVGLRLEGGKTPFEGLLDQAERKKLMQLLDEAPEREIPAIDSELRSYSADKQNYYRIKVLEKDPQHEILTYTEADTDGTMDALRDRILEKYYLSIRDKNPAAYQNEDQSWKNFELIKDQVADQYLEKQLKAIEKNQKESISSNDQRANFRFFAYLSKAKEALEKEPTKIDTWIKAKSEGTSSDKLPSQKPLSEQWLLVKEDYSIKRNKQEMSLDVAEAFSLPAEAWSKVNAPANGDIVFYRVKKQEENPEQILAMAELTNKAHDLLSAEAQRILMKDLLQQIKENGAISLKYLDLKPEQPIQQEETYVPDF